MNRPARRIGPASPTWIVSLLAMLVMSLALGAGCSGPTANDEPASSEADSGKCASGDPNAEPCAPGSTDDSGTMLSDTGTTTTADGDTLPLGDGATKPGVDGGIVPGVDSGTVPGAIATDANFKVAFIGDTATGANFKSVLQLIKSEAAKLVVVQRALTGPALS